jgi:hypothetical protein
MPSNTATATTNTPCTTCNQPNHHWRACKNSCSRCLNKHYLQPCPVCPEQYPDFDLKTAQAKALARRDNKVDAMEKEATAKEAELKRLKAELKKVRDTTGLKSGPLDLPLDQPQPQAKRKKNNRRGLKKKKKAKVQRRTQTPAKS